MSVMERQTDFKFDYWYLYRDHEPVGSKAYRIPSILVARRSTDMALEINRTSWEKAYTSSGRKPSVAGYRRYLPSFDRPLKMNSMKLSKLLIMNFSI